MRNIFNALHISVAILIWVLIFTFLLLLMEISDASIGIDTLAKTGPIFICIGALVALITFLTNIERNKSEGYLSTALDLLEKSYSTLSNVSEDGLPKNDRKVWLTSARLLMASEKVSESITDDSHKHIYDEIKEFWRGKFHDLLLPSIEGFPYDYFAETPDKMLVWSDGTRTPIASKSIAVLYRFIEWPPELDDPIQNTPCLDANEIEKMILRGPRNLGRFLQKVEEVKDRRKTIV